MARYLQRLLGEKEEVVHVANEHWAILLRNILPELALLVLGTILVTQILMLAQSRYVALGYLLLAIPIGMIARDWMVWNNHKYVVTTHRVIQMFGVLHKNVTDSSLEKVNDVKLVQSFFGRIFGYGDIEILTASELGVNRFTRIGNPVKFKRMMLDAKQRLEHDFEGVPQQS